jgi:chromate transport protein ChrA
VAAVVHHINEPAGVSSVTYDGHTYVGNPPAVSLFERDRSWFLIMTIIVVVAILVAFIDVTVRGRRNSGNAGIASAVAGALLVLFSLFGLLWGLASIGVVGLLLILASRPGETEVTVSVVRGDGYHVDA